MSSQLKVTVTFTNDSYRVVGEILPGSTLPSEVFLHENDGGVLGDYIGVCDLNQLQSRAVFKPGMGSFGNRFVRTPMFEKQVRSKEEVDSVIDVTEKRLTALDKELSEESSYSRIITIG